MPLPSHIRAERMDGRTESDWSITGEVGGQRIEVARVPFKGPDYDHAALAVVMAASSDLFQALEDVVAEQNGPPLIRYETQWRAAMAKAMAAMRRATIIPTTDEGGR